MSDDAPKITWGDVDLGSQIVAFTLGQRTNPNGDRGFTDEDGQPWAEAPVVTTYEWDRENGTTVDQTGPPWVGTTSRHEVEFEPCTEADVCGYEDELRLLVCIDRPQHDGPHMPAARQLLDRSGWCVVSRIRSLPASPSPTKEP